MHALRQAVIATTLVLALTLVALSAGAFAQTFTTIDVPGATFTEAHGINASGQIVGVYLDSSGGHGFLLDKKGTVTTIDVPGAVFTNARGINASGQIVGVYVSDTTHGYLLDKNGTFTTFDFTSSDGQVATFTQAFGINDRGQIVGLYGDDSGNVHGFVGQFGQ